MSRPAVPSRVSGALARLGFDVSALPVALRTAIAACAALWLGWLIGLDHPQWAAMTVWAASQPLREQILEKSFFRMAGTVVGVIAGASFLAIAGGDLLGLIIAVSVWTALCAAAGNLQRGYMAYGVTLAGYSAAMVALLDFDQPAHIAALATDRLLTVLLGVVVAMAVGMLLAPRRAEGVAAARARNLCAQLLRAMARDLRGEATDDRHAQDLLAQIGLIEEMLEPQAPGSPGSRKQARALARLVLAQVAAVVWLRRSETEPRLRTPSATADALEDAARIFESPHPPAEVLAGLKRARQTALHDAELGEVILGLYAAVPDKLAEDERSRESRTVAPGLRHRDWVGAREAGLRSASVMLLMGAVWLVTGWSTGPYLMLGAAVMTTVFSSMDFPARTIGYVFRGAAFGVIGALVCRWLVWPLAETPADLIFMIMPFILLGPFVMAHRKTGEGAFDYNMHLLLLLSPTFPLTGDFGHSMGIALAVLAGPGAAWLGYRFIYPATLSRRLDTLIFMMVREIEGMAARPLSGEWKENWRARLPHRMLRLSRWIEKTGNRDISAVSGGLMILTLGRSVMTLRALANDLALPRVTVKNAHEALASLASVSNDADAAVAALSRAAGALPAPHAEDARLLQNAARAVALHQAGFLERARRTSAWPRRSPAPS